ncbi:MAG: S8 family serine peptidase [candidate division Zixibacteria bacterium]|nr:S8 family serine peptidase [candidate division Zixibacteria bacterium]
MFKHIVTTIMTIMIVAILASPATAEHYYCRLGQMPLVLCDSIVSIKFDASIPTINIVNFAIETECLDGSHDVEKYDRDFWIYHVNPEWSIENTLSSLQSYPSLTFAFPVYVSEKGAVHKLNDLFIVSFREAVTQETIDSIYSYYDVTQIEGPLEITGSRRVVLTEDSPGNTLEIANLFYESGLVNYSQPAMFVPQLHAFTPNDSFFIHQYYLNNNEHEEIDIDVTRAWDITTGSNQAVVAVIDAGCIQSHEDLDSSRVLWNRGWDYYDDDYDPSPGNNSAHGVACQGIITAKLNNSLGVSGIAPQCKMIPIKIFDADEYGSSDNTIPEKAINRALSYYRFYKYVPMVISCSWGYRPGTYIDNIAAIIDEAVSMGVPIVFSSGNYGQYFCIGQSMGFPASLETTIGVGAVENDGDHWIYSSSGAGIDVVAPSGFASLMYGDIYTTDQVGMLGYNPAYGECDSTSYDYMCFFGGTSGAAPQVAGILALVRSRRPDIKDFHTLKNIIDSSAVDGIGDQYDTPGWDDAYGYGLANAFRALLAVSRGDANNDGTVDPLDIWYLIDYIYTNGYQQGEPVPHLLMGDANCDTDVNLLDILLLIGYLYNNGDAPPICFKYGD